MPVEIRELVIKTAIQSQPEPTQTQLDPQQLQTLRQQVIQACLRQLKTSDRKNPLER
ncbi:MULTISPECIES: DUF5908 family protein [Phytobacter]|jgi:hypothetical protein|uniref:Uncharacterized protein n=1 Tax=Phytobacter diazotrophicus TaxID=395631 RepID=A0ABN6LPL6_9ENTR|nr:MULTISPECIES: DUF5908 family protein [Phytobacter]MDU4152307.1 DUF5908 family protein [Enterobacteriaceae bacterium]MDU7378176.1 DUF5908 family protein [Enterobacteriaceae bacterium]BBE77745.1 hypothetical protein MRY16398_28010 [Phytobacter sp. MRY16-398]BDD51114.1 hypothetical protein PDTA9734_26010 [Phytobacter diazotrophicus]BEG82144.1 hypothetical protein PDTA9730_26000 [Phytobacter diazotrophicus]